MTLRYFSRREMTLLVKEQAAGRGAPISYDFEGGNNFLFDCRRSEKCLPGRFCLLKLLGMHYFI